MYKLKKISFLLIAALFVLGMVPKIALAETPNLKATRFEVSVKPEYDDPRTLVIYQGNLINTGNQTIPKGTPVSFIIPKGADINMACELTPQGGHDCQPYESKPIEGDKVKLSWKTSKDIGPSQNYPVFLEFYYDNKAVAPNKNFAYNFYPTFNMDDLSISLTQPKTATDFKLDPAQTSTNVQEGLKNYFLDFSNKTPEDSISIKVSYTKSDNIPTYDKPQVGSQAQDNASGSKSPNPLSNPAVLVPLLLFVAIMAFLIIYAVKNPKQPSVRSNTNFKPARKNTPSSNSRKNEKRKLREALLSGKISEQTYKELIAELED